MSGIRHELESLNQKTHHLLESADRLEARQLERPQ